MSERYVHPPLVGQEPRSERAAIWRFRLVLLIAVAIVAAIAVSIVWAALPAGEQDPGVGIAPVGTQQSTSGRSHPFAPAR